MNFPPPSEMAQRNTIKGKRRILVRGKKGVQILTCQWLIASHFAERNSLSKEKESLQEKGKAETLMKPFILLMKVDVSD